MAAVITSQSNSRTAGSASSLTFSHTTDGNDLYLVVGIYETNAEFQVCTFNGVQMANVTKERAGVGAGLSIFFLPAVTAVTANIVITPPAAREITAVALNISGSGGVRSISYQYAPGTSSTSVTVKSAIGDLILDFSLTYAANQNWTPGAGQTLVYKQFEATTFEKSMMSSKTATSTSTVMTETLTINNTITTFGIAIGVSSGGGGGGSSAHSAVF